MQSSLKKSALRLITFMLCLSVAFAVALYVQGSGVQAEVSETESIFAVTDVEVYNSNGESGLTFNVTANNAWRNGRTATELGTIVFPKANGEISEEKTLSENVNDLDAIKFKVNSSLEKYSSTIIYDRETLREMALRVYNQTQILNVTLQTIIDELSLQEFVAVPYAVIDGVVEYGDTKSDRFFRENTLSDYNSTVGYNALAELENGETLQSLYNTIDESAKEFHLSSTLNATGNVLVSIDYASLGLTSDQAISVWNMYRSDNPLYYWMAYSLNYTDTHISVLVVEEYANGEVRAEQTEQLYSSIEEFTELTKGETDEYNIALAYHDAIINKIDYAYDDNGEPSNEHWAHSIVGAFDGLGGVCDTYARSFQLLLNLSGVENMLVTGESNGEEHIWNLVKLADGNWYWCDLTKDDTPNWMWGISYNYFCVNDTQDVNWKDGGSSTNVRTFLNNHVYDLPTGLRGEYLHALPERATEKYSSEGLTLRETFTIDNNTYALVGYNAVQLTKSTETDTLIIPESINYGNNAYSVISVGTIDSKGLFNGRDVVSCSVVEVPKSVIYIWDLAFRSVSNYITVAEDNEYFMSVDGVLFTKDLDVLIRYPASKPETEYVIPDETTRVAYGAFESLECLSKLTIHDVLFGITCLGYRYEKSQNAISSEIAKICNYVNEISIKEGTAFFIIENGAIYSKSKNTLYGIFDKTLTTYELPAEVKKIDDGIIMGSNRFAYLGQGLPLLESFTVEDGNTEYSAYSGVLYNKNLTVFRSIPNAIKSIKVPRSIISVDSFIFDDHQSLESIIFEENSELKIIGSWAFDGCSSLTSIKIPEGVMSIGDFAFSGCSSLTSVEIPNSVTSIGDSAFYGCKSLTKVNYLGTIDEWVQIKLTSSDSNPLSHGAKLYTDDVLVKEIYLTSDVINGYIFYGCSSLETVQISDSVTSIGSYAFSGCSSLATVSFSENSKLVNIGRNSFLRCSSLTSIEIPDSVTSIGGNAFTWCSSLESVSFGENSQLTSIGGSVFSGCSSLKSIEIPDAVTNIGSFAFYGCSSLTTVIIGEKSLLSNIANGAFHHCYRLVEVINKSSLNIEKNSENGYIGFYSLLIHTEESKVVTVDDYLFITVGNTNYLCGYVGKNTEIILPDNYNGNKYIINRYAFYGYTTLTHIQLSDGVARIDSYAFQGCNSLVSIKISNNTMVSGTGIFIDCSSLINIEINSHTITSSTFKGCSSLTSVTLLYGVTSIEKSAFSECSLLSSIIIGKNLDSIGDDAFSGCSLLANITFEGTVAEWNAIEKGSNWNKNILATKVICSDGEVEI